VATYASGRRPARRLSRRSRVVSAVLAAAIVVGLAIALWPPNGVPFRAARSPLGPSNGYGPDSLSPLFYRSMSLPFGDERTNFVLRFRPHSRFRFDFDIENRGRSPLRIEGVVPTSPDWAGMMHIRRLLFQHNPRSFSHVGATPDPLTIEPGRSGVVVPVIETDGPCRATYSPGGAEGLESIQLRYSYRGEERTEWYPLPVVIGMFCGDPKLWVDVAVSG